MKYFQIILFSLFYQIVLAQSTTITPGNSQPNLISTSVAGGILPPRLTTVQRDAISNPIEGLTIYNLTSHCLEIYREVGWFNLCLDIYTNHLNKLLGGSGGESASSFLQTTDGGYILAGTSSSSASDDISGINHGSSDCWIVKLDALGNIVWNKLLGGDNDEEIRSILQTSDGGYIFVGYSLSSASGDVSATNHGSSDCWIVKLDALGNIVWNKLLGGSSAEYVNSFQKTSDGGYIMSAYSSSSASGDVSGTIHGVTLDSWIVKLDALGNIVWNKLLGGNGYDNIISVQQTSDSGYILAGRSDSSTSGDVTATNHGGFYDCWVVKIDALGNIIWNKLLGGNGYDEILSVQQTSDGGYIMAGDSGSSANGDVTATNHGGGSDCWIVKLDALGNIIWNKLLGGSSGESGYRIQQTTDGGYIMAGYSSSSASGDVSATNHGSSDCWIVKLDALGNIIWNKLLGGSGGESASSILQTSDGGYIFSGTSSSSASGNVTHTNHGNGDIWVVKLDSYGNIY